MRKLGQARTDNGLHLGRQSWGGVIKPGGGAGLSTCLLIALCPLAQLGAEGFHHKEWIALGILIELVRRVQIEFLAGDMRPQ